MNTLAQALLWFYEGCSASTDLMAIVKFTATLDALACGHRQKGILQLINIRLGIQDCDEISPGLNLKQAVKNIYKYGRSRTVHGTNHELRHDWSEIAVLAEQFAQSCLFNCIEWVTKNPSCDNPSFFAEG